MASGVIATQPRDGHATLLTELKAETQIIRQLRQGNQATNQPVTMDHSATEPPAGRKKNKTEFPVKWAIVYLETWRQVKVWLVVFVFLVVVFVILAGLKGSSLPLLRSLRAAAWTAAKL